MKTCKSCQTQISDKAKKCPHCGADQRNWFGRHKILTGIGIIIIIGAILGATGSKSGTTPTTLGNDATPSKTEQPTTAPIVVDGTGPGWRI